MKDESFPVMCMFTFSSSYLDLPRLSYLMVYKAEASWLKKEKGQRLKILLFTDREFHAFSQSGMQCGHRKRLPSFLHMVWRDWFSHGYNSIKDLCWLQRLLSVPRSRAHQLEGGRADKKLEGICGT